MLTLFSPFSAQFLPTYAGMFAVIVVAQITESVLGFGATILAIALGSQLLPLDQLVATMVLLGVGQSTTNILRDRPSIQWTSLKTFILPIGLTAAVIGIATRRHLPDGALKIALGAVVICIAIIQLKRVYGEPKPLSRALATLVILCGGFFQGLSACGGPMMVYFASRTFRSATAVRSTLGVVWLLLSIPILFGFTQSGVLTPEALARTFWLIPALVTGILIGKNIRMSEILHQRVTYAVLAFAGLMLMVN